MYNNNAIRLTMKLLQFQCLPLLADAVIDMVIVMYRILTSVISVLITHRHELNMVPAWLLQPNSRQCFGLGTLSNTYATAQLRFSICFSSLRGLQLMSRGAPDPEFCYPAGSGSMPDPDLNRILIIWIRPVSGSSRIRIQTRQEKKNYPFCSTTGWNWNDCLPCFVTELLLKW